LKISKRLQQIEKMVSPEYDHIWDCCCDHGILGFALLSSQASSKVHFVDIVAELMTTVEKKLESFYPNSAWEAHCLDVVKLPLARYQGKHLIIIAGVGGDLMIQFIEAINQQHKNLNINFLLCPVHHQFSLRQKLIELDFSLKDEVLIEENRRFYEILLVSSLNEELTDELSKKNNKISPVGNKIWLSTSSKQTETVDKYLQKTLNHYQRIQQGYLQTPLQSKANNVQDIIDAYRAIKS
jgi:tRNA (adenine22-N1)-methyltransferase